MRNIWVYKYKVEDRHSGDEIYYQEFICTSKEEAMKQLETDYARDASDFEMIEGVFSDCRASHTSKDGYYIQYRVFTV